MDANGFGELLTEDARMVFGNAEPMTGRTAITAGVKAFYASIAALHSRRSQHVDERRAHDRRVQRHLSTSGRQPGHCPGGNDLPHERCRKNRRLSRVRGSVTGLRRTDV